MMPKWFDSRRKWFKLGIGVKRWLAVLMLGVFLISLGISYILHELNLTVTESWFPVLAGFVVGLSIMVLALYRLTRTILAPYRIAQQGPVVDIVYAHRTREKGPKVVAIGGGTGLPSVLRALKTHTGNITAVVTVADDGGSSGRLRREHGVLPPGDLRNNIAALADDESLMTQLFQYRFDGGDLGGHAFGNLFITALTGVTGSTEAALIETAQVLNIRGRVLPASLENVDLIATVHLGSMGQTIKIKGESQIASAGAKIERIELCPIDVNAYSESITAILEADLVVIGPGSLYTSILPNLLVQGIRDALRATNAYVVYICNVATQPGETDDYTVVDHIMALERHIGPHIFQAVLANNCYPVENAGENTHYVMPGPQSHDSLAQYRIVFTDLTDAARPWRHDPHKLSEQLINLLKRVQSGELAHKSVIS